MKKSVYFIFLFALIISAIAVYNCSSDSKETCSQDEICTAKYVTACCTNDICVYKYNGKTYSDSQKDKDQLALDTGCTSKSSKIDPGNNEELKAVISKLNDLMAEAHEIAEE
jgi:hypothetical protein